MFNVTKTTPKKDALMVLKEADIDTQVYTVLNKLGMPTNLKGYAYSVYAIHLGMQMGTFDISVTKDLYPAIAKAFETTNSRVERAIRHAVEVTADQVYSPFYQQLFKATKINVGKPVNSEFISRIVCYLLLENPNLT